VRRRRAKACSSWLWLAPEDNLALLDNGIHLMEICDVLKRISPDEKNVSAHAGL
jgi:hypothetical protein